MRVVSLAAICLATAVAWATAVTVHTHHQMQWLFESNTKSHTELLRRLAELGQSPPSVSPPGPPSPFADVLFGAQQGLTLLALCLLCIGLVMVGRRLWAVLTLVTLVALPALLDDATLLGDLLSPTNLSTPLPTGWPWPEVALQLAVVAVPVAVAALLLQGRPAVRRPTPSVVAALVAVCLCVLIWVGVDSAGFVYAWRPSLRDAATAAIGAVGLAAVAARLDRRGLLAAASVAGVLVVLHAVVGSGVLDPSTEPTLSPGRVLLELTVISAGPAVVLAYPKVKALRSRTARTASA